MEYNQQVELLNKYAYAYYVLDNPIVDDLTYDKLYNQVKTYEQEHNIVNPISPTQRVGDMLLSKFSKHKHVTKMWSLDNVYNDEELYNWYTKILEAYPTATFTCSPKYDGLSLNCIYQHELQHAVTRGDGIVGEDVLSNAKTIYSIPMSISVNTTVEVKGEVLISKDNFTKLNQSRLEDELPLFSNPRNASAGSLRQLDPKVTASRKLQFIPWFTSMHIDNSYYKSLSYLKSLGYNFTESLVTYCKTYEDILNSYKHILATRDKYPYMLDGVVITVDEYNIQEELGYNVKAPRFSIAYKFPAIETTTQVLDITYQVGRTGIITPVAELDPVNIDGVTVSRVTLHNFDYIKDMDIRVKDKVTLIRSGDVIPKIISVLDNLRTNQEVIIVKPTNCPTCNSILIQDNTSLKCINTLCKDRVIYSILHFVSREAMNIDGLGYESIVQLYDAGYLRNILDIYYLKDKDLLSLDGWQSKKVTKLLESIENTKRIELSKFIYGLGIPNMGKSNSNKLATYYGLELFTSSLDMLLSKGTFTSDALNITYNYIQDNLDIISKCVEVIQPKVRDVSNVNTDSKYYNKQIVITGKLSVSRDVLKQKLIEQGAIVTDSVSKHTDYLVCGENAGSKLAKANKLNIPVITEEQI